MKITVKGDMKRVSIQMEPVEDGVVSIPDFVAFKLSALIDKAGKHGGFMGYVSYVEGKWRCFEEYEMRGEGYTPIPANSPAAAPVRKAKV